jgi:hypothetical protein
MSLSWLLVRALTVLLLNTDGTASARKDTGFNPSTPNDHYSGRTAPLTSKRCVFYIYSPNIGTEYFKHGIYSPFFLFKMKFFFHNSNVFGSCIIHILYTGCAKIKKNNNSGAKMLTEMDAKHFLVQTINIISEVRIIVLISDRTHSSPEYCLK